MARFSWAKLSPSDRFGSSPDEIITLYRGVKPDQIDPVRGMLSTAVQLGDVFLVERVVSAVEEEDRETLSEMRLAHMRDLTKIDIISPFVSACESKSVAHRYASDDGVGLIVTFEVRADEVMRACFPNQYEALVVGTVALDSFMFVE